MTRIIGPAWRIAPCGTTECYVSRIIGDTAIVSSRVGRGWAKKPMEISTDDLFADRSAARREYRQRREAAGGIAGNYTR